MSTNDLKPETNVVYKVHEGTHRPSPALARRMEISQKANAVRWAKHRARQREADARAAHEARLAEAKRRAEHPLLQPLVNRR